MTQYVGIRSEGGLIPYDVLDKIAKEESGLGQQAKDFGLLAGRRLTDEIARAWSDAQDYWHIFQRRAASLPESETGTTLTRKWISDLLNEQLLGYELTYQPSGALIGGKNYPISHRAGAGEESPPIQIEGFRTDLDKRPEGRRLSPQALVQEYLNNSDSHLWGIVSNGFLLRLLRDTSRTSRPSYLEFDLQSILEGNRFNEFALFYRVCHRTRLPRTAEDSPSCWLEKFFQLSIEQGGRVRDKLRDGVEDALKTLGTGFLRHPKNEALRERVKTGTLTSAEFHRQLLRLVYRLLFLMVAEERRMIVPEGPEADRRQSLFDRYYSVGRLRSLAEKAIEPSTFGDLWIGLQQTFALFEDGDSNPLGIPPLNGDLFSAIAIKDLQGTHLYNNVLLGGMGRLSLFEDHRVRQRVNYSALDVEELGSVYESLLDFQPVFTEQPKGIAFELRVGSERKSSGSYYTRPELVRELIESALVPVMQDRLASAKDSDTAKEKEKKQQAILSMSVCDPACGSGHFLLAAARRLGRELARVRTGEDEPTPKEFHLAVRDVIAHCIYGVDVNPLAVDLCKLALWLEGHWTGKPLSFLDHRIKLGNSLIGVLDMDALKDGIPDEAFNPITGDDKKVASAFKKKNREERTGQPSLRFDPVEHVHQYAADSEQFIAIAEDSPADVRRKKEAYEKTRQRPDWWHDWVGANLWSAAFFLPLTKYDDPTVSTHDKFIAYIHGKHVDALAEGAATGFATDLKFFHWPLEFPEVFERSGFDVLLGNPPWERPEFHEESHWADVPEFQSARTKPQRDSLIQEFRESSDPVRQSRYRQFELARHNAEAETKFWRQSRRFPLSATGKFNLFALFSELDFRLTNPWGRAGFIVPSGIATDDTCKDFFGEVNGKGHLVSLFDFENREGIFPGVYFRYRFCLVTLSKLPVEKAKFSFFLTQTSHLRDAERWFDLEPSELAMLNPNTKTCPIFRTRRDAALTRSMYSRVPVLVDENKSSNPWQIRIRRIFNMGHSEVFSKAKRTSDLFSLGFSGECMDRRVSLSGEVLLPIYEGKMFNAFNHRAASVITKSANVQREAQPDASGPNQLSDPCFVPTPSFWMPETELLKMGCKPEWVLAYKDVTSTTNERTMIAAILPTPCCNYSIRCVFGTDKSERYVPLLLANFNSIVFDYLARQSVSGLHLSEYILKQLPVLPPDGYVEQDANFISERVIRLAYTSWDVQDFAAACLELVSLTERETLEHEWRSRVNVLSSGSEHKMMKLSFGPFPWDEEARARQRADLDAYFAHMYGLSRLDLVYVLDPQEALGPEFPGETFRILKEREEKEYGEYRTRRLVLEAFDRLAASPRFRDEMSKRESAIKVAEIRTASVH